MRYDLRGLPANALQKPVSDATAALVRLDERLDQSPLGPGCLERLQFLDACASLWIDGELVHLEDLVLHDALRDIRAPTHELTIAHSILRARRKILAHDPDWALGPGGVLGLRVGDGADIGPEKGPKSGEGRDGQVRSKEAEENPLAGDLAALDEALARSTAVLDGAPLPARDVPGRPAPLVYDPERDTIGRLQEWQEVLRQTEDLPCVLRAAVLLDAWTVIDVSERTPWIGRLLVAASLRGAGLTGSKHLATVNLGLKHVAREKRTNRDPVTRLTAYVSALQAAATAGLKEHDKLVLARQVFARRLTGRRRSSKLPDLVDLVLSRPMVSAGMIAREIGVTPQAALRLVDELNLRELTGRGRFRVWGVV